MNNFNNSFYDIFNYLPTGIFIIDSDKKICFWNSVLAEWSGLSKEQVLNNSLSNILPKYSFPYYNLQIESVLNGGPTVFFSSELHSQFIFNTNDALNYKIHSTTISALPHNNSEKHYALFTLIDETTQTNTIKENFKITNEYRIEIENRKAIEKDLIYAKEIAEENNKLKSAFLTNMSHEVRTPMNGIIGFSQMLVRDSVSEEKRQTYANIIIDSGKQLLAIVDDILDISKIETNQVNITEEFFSLNNLMLEIYVFFKPKVAEKNISILIHKPLPDGHDIVFTDRQILKQILFNLIANSLKFTIEGFIKYGYNIEVNQIVFFTEDSGIGISSEYHAVIFDRFRQVDNSLTKKYGGTGLGLAICKGLVDVLGGSINLKSELKKGSHFYFVLPLLPQQIKYDEAFTQNENFDNTKCTVLLADDEENNAILIQEILNEIGIQIIHAQNGQEVLNIIEKHTDIQLILMDIQMPHMNGIDAFTELRKRGVKIPVIAISAFCSKSDIDNFLKIGFDSFLPKPIIEEEFIALVSKLLKRKQPSNKNPKAQSIFHKLFFKKR